MCQLHRIYLSGLLYTRAHVFLVTSYTQSRRVFTCRPAPTGHMCSYTQSRRVFTCRPAPTGHMCSYTQSRRVFTCRPAPTGHMCSYTQSRRVFTCRPAPYDMLETLETTPGAFLLSPCRRHARYVSVPGVTMEQSNVTL